MIKVNVGGVPEHFNLAWHLAIESGMFAEMGVQINWVDVPGGTGAMCKQLRNQELDIAIALTEGVVSDIVKDNPSKIVQFYVNSPLRWGIFVNAKSDICDVSQMQGKQYAISRFQSGSHLMAFVNAANRQLHIQPNDFVVVGDLDGARKALANNEAQLFLWEKFTTKPYVDNGEFRMIGECNTPWPCFVVVASNKFIQAHGTILNNILDVVNLHCTLLKNNTAAPHLIAERYGIQEQDAAQWFKELEYASHHEMGAEQWAKILDKLMEFSIIEYTPELEQICYTKNIETI
jgi:sulfonate transport system substrate-binding protein